jgi:hypothetical protein
MLTPYPVLYFPSYPLLCSPVTLLDSIPVMF